MSGRYNTARIITKDRSGETPAIDGISTFRRFNPAAGLAGGQPARRAESDSNCSTLPMPSENVDLRTALDDVLAGKDFLVGLESECGLLLGRQPHAMPLAPTDAADGNGRLVLPHVDQFIDFTRQKEMHIGG